MFNNSKYTKWYFKIIENAQKRFNLSGYVERHHIIPRSLSGNDDKENLVNLTAKEHFICHLLLTKMTSGLDNRKMWHALWGMANQKRIYQDRYVICSRQYEHIKKNNAKLLSEKFLGKPSGRKGQPCTWGDKISKTLSGRKPSKERNEKISRALTGKTRPPRTIEWTENQRKTIEKNKKICEICGETVTKSAYTRFHGKNCNANER